MEWRVSNVDILRADGKLYPMQDVLIKDDRISAIEAHPGLAGKDVIQDLNGSGKLVIPGLVNAHLHSHDRFDKGRFDNLPLEIWMVAYNSPLGVRDWTVEDCYLRTTLNCLEQIRSGVTTVIDDVVHSDPFSEEKIDAVFRAYEDVGLRARVTIAWSDLPYYDTIPFLSHFLPDEIKTELDSKKISPNHIFGLWENFANCYNGRVSFGISPSGPQRCSESFMKSAWEIARKLDLPIYVHVLETKIQQITAYLNYGTSLTAYMNKIGLLSSDTNLVHGVWLSDPEIEMIARSGANVIHNPISNLKLGSGIAPISKLLSAGVPLGLGTDNNNCNDSANLLEAMKTAALIGKVTSGRYEKWPGAKDALGMATRGGAACYGNSDIGDIRPGGKADFSIFNLKSPNFFPSHDRLFQLVYAENGTSLDTVVVDGKIIMRNGAIVSIDESKIMEKLEARQERIIATIDKCSERAGEILPHLKSAYDLCVNLANISSLEKPRVIEHF
jgi:5-methylthioadenosine/S-adenosylhomocysteine deaminase